MDSKTSFRNDKVKMDEEYTKLVNKIEKEFQDKKLERKFKSKDRMGRVSRLELESFANNNYMEKIERVNSIEDNNNFNSIHKNSIRELTLGRYHKIDGKLTQIYVFHENFKSQSRNSGINNICDSIIAIEISDTTESKIFIEKVISFIKDKKMTHVCAERLEVIGTGIGYPILYTLPNVYFTLYSKYINGRATSHVWHKNYKNSDFNDYYYYRDNRLVQALIKEMEVRK